YHAGYYATALPYAEAGGIYPVTATNLPPAVVGRFGADLGTGTAFMSPATSMGALASYLEQAPDPKTPPPAHLAGLSLIGYVLVAGPVSFFVLDRLHRRQLAWVVVPGLAVVTAVVAGLVGPRAQRGPVLAEVRVVQAAPGGHLAQVTSLGLVHLP